MHKFSFIGQLTPLQELGRLNKTNEQAKVGGQYNYYQRFTGLWTIPNITLASG